MDNRVRGERHHLAKLTAHDVDLIFVLHEDGMSTRQLARKFEVSQSAIARIITGRNWNLGGVA